MPLVERRWKLDCSKIHFSAFYAVVSSSNYGHLQKRVPISLGYPQRVLSLLGTRASKPLYSGPLSWKSPQSSQRVQSYGLGNTAKPFFVRTANSISFFPCKSPQSPR
mmetsp:Transcript_6006/g.9371  ORF Transcript_6006/g.9371 Transcript_6006/m.9371 type:complete len:107 (+) Transcript_6006:337-657(+)